MSKDEFKASIFDILQYLIKNELSDTAKKLIVHYFNTSASSSSRLKAIDAIIKYYGEAIPSGEDQPPRLKKLMDRMAIEADAWDNE